MADEGLLGGQVEPAGGGTRGDDEGAGVDCLGADLELDGVGAEIGGVEVSHSQFGAEAGGLLLHVLDEFRPLDALGPAGEVFDQGGDGELAAWFVAFEDERLEVGTGGVDGCGEAGAAGSEDDEVAGFWIHGRLQCKCLGRGNGSRGLDRSKALTGGLGENGRMANLVLVYGMRLLPADELAKVADAPLELKNGNSASVTMHVLEGSRESIEAQLKHSLDAFFDFYPEI